MVIIALYNARSHKSLSCNPTELETLDIRDLQMLSICSVSKLKGNSRASHVALPWHWMVYHVIMSLCQRPSWRPCSLHEIGWTKRGYSGNGNNEGRLASWKSQLSRIFSCLSGSQRIYKPLIGLFFSCIALRIEPCAKPTSFCCWKSTISSKILRLS